MGWFRRSPRHAKVSSFGVVKQLSSDAMRSPSRAGRSSPGSPSKYDKYDDKARKFSIHAATSHMEDALHNKGGHEFSATEYTTTIIDKLFYTLDELMLNNFTTALVIATPYAFIILPIESAVWYFMRTGRFGGGVCDEDDADMDDEVMCVPEDYSYSTAFWETWGYQADPGTHSEVTGGWHQLVAALIALAGMVFWFINAAFIVDRFQEFMERLKRGRNKVVESDHVVILGFTDKTLALICELCLAMESENGGVIVVMDQRNPAEVQEMIDEELDAQYDLRGTKLVVRQGNPSFVNDLRRISTAEARAVVVLAPTREGDDVEQADATVLRTVLSLKGMPERMQGHIVAELNDVDNRQIVELIGEMDVETVVSHDICGRLMLMAARHPGLAMVYDRVFGFQGNEFYLKNWPELAGKSFGEVMTMFPDAVPIGVISTKSDDEVEYLRKLRNAQTNRSIRAIRYGMDLNPSTEYVMQENDQLLVVAIDDDTYRPMPAPEVYNVPFVQAKPHNMIIEKTLLCGWRRDMEDLITVLDCEVGRGSEVHILAEVPIQQREEDMKAGGFDPSSCSNVTLVHHIGNSAIRRQLLQLPLGEFDNVLILADQSRETKPLDSDAHNLATMLLIRDIRATMLMEMNLDAKKTQDLTDELAEAAAKSITHAAGSDLALTIGNEGNEEGSQAPPASSPAPMLSEMPHAHDHDKQEKRHGLMSWLPNGPNLSPLGKKHKNAVNQKRSPMTARDAARQRSLRKLQTSFARMDTMDPSLASVDEDESKGNEARDDAEAAGAKQSTRTNGTSERTRRSSRSASNGNPRADRASGAGEGVIGSQYKMHGRSQLGEGESKWGSDGESFGGLHPGFPGCDDPNSPIEDDCLICCEILDSRTRSTLYYNPTVAHEAEYVLSHMTVSKVISMVAMKREVRGVLEELLAEEGQSFFVMPITRYIDLSTTERHMSFWELGTRIKQSGDLLIGYQRIEAEHEMEINPPDKKEKITWRDGDFVVVVCDICRVFRAGVTPHTGKRRKVRPPGSTPGSAKGRKRFSFGAVGSTASIALNGHAQSSMPPTTQSPGGAGAGTGTGGFDEVFSPASTLQTLTSPEMDRGLQLGSLGHTPSGRTPVFPIHSGSRSMNPSDSLSLSAASAPSVLPEINVPAQPIRTQQSLSTVQAFEQEVTGRPTGDADASEM